MGLIGLIKAMFGQRPGRDISGLADATLDAGAIDESVALMQGVSVYQLTDQGLALQATLQGTKYWQDDKLND